MRESTIARNYAEALVELAKRAKDLRGWGALIQSIADAMNRDEKLRTFLETPRVDAGTKNAILRRALSDRAPANFVRFVTGCWLHRHLPYGVRSDNLKRLSRGGQRRSPMNLREES